MSQVLNVQVVERGVEGVADFDGPDSLTLKQTSAESTRSFAQRVAERLSTLSARGVRVGRAVLHLSANRQGNALARRFGLARAVLSQLPTFESSEFTLGGPLAHSPQGQLDLHALTEILELQVRGSATTIQAAVARKPLQLPTGGELHWHRAA